MTEEKVVKAEEKAKHYKHTIKSTKELIPYINNSRTHSDDQILQIASSIKEFGFTSPVLIDDQGGVIAGHGRIMAARKLNIDEIPCIVLSGLTEAQKKEKSIKTSVIPWAKAYGVDEDVYVFDFELRYFDPTKEKPNRRDGKQVAIATTQQAYNEYKDIYEDLKLMPLEGRE